MPTVDGFRPSTSAPLFGNGPWPIRSVSRLGLCGGMAYLARDVHEAGLPQLRGTSSAHIPGPLARLVLRRSVDSMRGRALARRWWRATRAPDSGATLGAARHAMAEVDAGRLTPLGIVLARSRRPWAVFLNHVELVYGYDLDGDLLTLRVYDSNLPGADGLTLTLDLAGPDQIRTNGTALRARPGVVRGLLLLPYAWRDPSSGYVDDAVVTVEDGAVTVTNTGSTTFDPTRGYALGRLGSVDRLPLDVAVDPGVRLVRPLPPPWADPAAPIRLWREGRGWIGRAAAPTAGPASGIPSSG